MKNNTILYYRNEKTILLRYRNNKINIFERAQTYISQNENRYIKEKRKKEKS